MNEQYSALRSNVSMLGKVLGETIKDALGEHILERVETIRKLSKSSRAGNDANRQELLTTLQNLSNDELLPVARAFSQFLNLAIYGAVRQVDDLEELDIGIQAMAAIPVGAAGEGIGESDVRVNFGGVTFFSGDHLYADNTGIILSEDPLDIE